MTQASRWNQNLCYRQLVLRVFLEPFLLRNTADAIESLPDIRKRYVQRCKAEADIVRFAKIRDDVHLFDERAVDAIPLRVADANV